MIPIKMNFPEDMLDKLDALCKTVKLNRSAAIRLAVNEWIKKNSKILEGGSNDQNG